MKPICLIAARDNSKGVPKKNIRLLANKPLIAHTIESCLNSDIFSNIVVSTESNEIANIAKKFGAEVPFLRPKKLATDSASMSDVFLHAIPKLVELGYDFKIMVNRDCTVPFIQNSSIIGSIELLKQKKCNLVCGVYKQHHNPYFNMMEFNKNGFLKFCKKSKQQLLSRQKSPIVYQLNGLFTFYTDQFMKYKKLYMPKILPYEIPPETGLMIDTEFEFQIANMIATKKIQI